jgi:hypothetical protein
MKTHTLKLTGDQLGELHIALLDRYHTLTQEINDKTKHGSILRIAQRQRNRLESVLQIVDLEMREIA